MELRDAVSGKTKKTVRLPRSLSTWAAAIPLAFTASMRSSMRLLFRSQTHAWAVRGAIETSRAPSPTATSGRGHMGERLLPEEWGFPTTSALAPSRRARLMGSERPEGLQLRLELGLSEDSIGAWGVDSASRSGLRANRMRVSVTRGLLGHGVRRRPRPKTTAPPCPPIGIGGSGFVPLTPSHTTGH